MDESERQIKEIFQKNLLEAYGKDGDAFLLKPSQEMCSLMKEAMSVFDPFSGTKCSDGQYADMLEDFHNSGMILQLTPGTNKELTLLINTREVEGKITISYSAYGIISMIGEVFEPGNSSVNTIKFSYIPRDILHLEMKLENEFELMTYIELTNNNTLDAIESRMLYSEGIQSVEFTGVYKNSQLNLQLLGTLDGTNIDCNLSGDMRKSY